MSLTESEVRRLLAVVMAYDNRKPGDAAVLAWAEAARRGGWTLDGALDAVHQHYSRSTEWIMPGHITETLRAAARQPAPFRALPPVDPGMQRAIGGALPEMPTEPYRPHEGAFTRWGRRRQRRRMDAHERAVIQAELDRIRPPDPPPGPAPVSPPDNPNP